MKKHSSESEQTVGKRDLYQAEVGSKEWSPTISRYSVPREAYKGEGRTGGRERLS